MTTEETAPRVRLVFRHGQHKVEHLRIPRSLPRTIQQPQEGAEICGGARVAGIGLLQHPNATTSSCGHKLHQNQITFEECVLK